MEKVELTKDLRKKYVHRYFMDLQRWIPYKVEGLGESKARIRSVITGKAEYVDTQYFLTWFGGCDVQEIDWKPELHWKYLQINRSKGSKSKFVVSVFREWDVNIYSTFTELRDAWAYVTEIKRQSKYKGVRIWFNHVRETRIKLQ